jgi:hypothetical protein
MAPPLSRHTGRCLRNRTTEKPACLLRTAVKENPSRWVLGWSTISSSFSSRRPYSLPLPTGWPRATTRQPRRPVPSCGRRCSPQSRPPPRTPRTPAPGQGELRRPRAKCHHRSPASTPLTRRPTPSSKRFGRSPFLDHEGKEIKNE